MDYKKIRDDFPALNEWTYLDTAFVGLYPRQVRAGYDEFLDQWMNFNTLGKNTILNNWLDKTKNVRRLISSFIGAKADEIAFTMSTGSGLNIVVNGTKWSRGDNVVFPEWEHNPLDTMTLRKKQVEIRSVSVKNGKIELADFEKVIDDNTKLVQLSQVSYINGFRFNLKDVADIVHEYGGKLLVDATQAVGAFKIDVKSEEVDFLSAAPYKYLMGPAGLAFLYINEKNIEELTPDRIGWKNQIWKGEHAEEPLEKRETAEKFEYGTLHFQGVFGLEKSIEYINNVGIDSIERRNLHLSDYLWSRLYDLGLEMYTPTNTKSTIVSFFHEDAIKLSLKLMTEKIKVTGRTAHGGHIRVSTHFYNSETDIDNFIKKLKDIQI
jgi:cysteine desulfurase/selenocysteine lyase